MTTQDTEKIRILFVDDDPNVVAGLRRQFRAMRSVWDMRFAEGSSEAMEIVEKERLDVVVTDMRMPGMDGAALLREVMRIQPDTVRIVLSGQSDMESIFRAIGPSHQYLNKPCDAVTLEKVITRASHLRALLREERLLELASSADVMPTLPKLYQSIVAELASPSSSLRRVGEIIAEDLGMTAKILQLVNSAFFGLGREVSHPSEAVTYLGVDTVRALVLSVEVFRQFEIPASFGVDLEELWRHGMEAAGLARAIASDLGMEKRHVDQAFTAGMMHDIGLVCLASRSPVGFGGIVRCAETSKEALASIEYEVLETSHAELGAYLLGIWGLPDPIIEAVAHHERPSRCPHRDVAPLTAVHVAEAILAERPGARFLCEIDEDYLDEVGVLERLDAWREEAGVDCVPV